MLLFAPYNQTSLRLPTMTHISYTSDTMDRPDGGGQIPKLGSGGIKISSTLSYFHNSIALSLFFSYFPTCIHNTSISRLGYNNNNSVATTDPHSCRVFAPGSTRVSRPGTTTSPMQGINSNNKYVYPSFLFICVRLFSPINMQNRLAC